MNDYDEEWQGWRAEAPAPRSDGDEFTTARSIINAARLVMGPGAPSPDFSNAHTTEERRRVLARFLTEHGIPVPTFVPALYGWMDCYTGKLATPQQEPGANGRTHS